MGLAPGLLPGRVTLDDGRDWFADAWPELPEAEGLDAAGILRGRRRRQGRHARPARRRSARRLPRPRPRRARARRGPHGHRRRPVPHRVGRSRPTSCCPRPATPRSPARRPTSRAGSARLTQKVTAARHRPGRLDRSPPSWPPGSASTSALESVEQHLGRDRGRGPGVRRAHRRPARLGRRPRRRGRRAPDRGGRRNGALRRRCGRRGRRRGPGGHRRRRRRRGRGACAAAEPGDGGIEADRRGRSHRPRPRRSAESAEAHDAPSARRSHLLPPTGGGAAARVDDHRPAGGRRLLAAARRDPQALRPGHARAAARRRWPSWPTRPTLRLQPVTTSTGSGVGAGDDVRVTSHQGQRRPCRPWPTPACRGAPPLLHVNQAGGRANVLDRRQRAVTDVRVETP